MQILNKNTYENTIFKEYTFIKMKSFLLSLGLFSVNGVYASGNADDKSSTICVERPIEFAYPRHYRGWSAPPGTVKESDIIEPVTGNKIPGVNDWFSSPGSFEKSSEANFGIYDEQKYMEDNEPIVEVFEKRMGLMHAVEPVLENAIKTLQKVVDVRLMGRRRRLDTTEVEFHTKTVSEAFGITVDTQDTSDRNNQKALTAKILKSLDNNAPAVTITTGMDKIKTLQPQINDFERRAQLAHHVQPVLKYIVEELQEIVNVTGMARRRLSTKRKTERNYISKRTHEERVSLLSSAEPHIEHIYNTYTNMLTSALTKKDLLEDAGIGSRDAGTLNDKKVKTDMLKNLVEEAAMAAEFELNVPFLWDAPPRSEGTKTYYTWEPDLNGITCSRPYFQRFGETMVFNRYDENKMTISQQTQPIIGGGGEDCVSSDSSAKVFDAKYVLEKHFDSSSAVLVINGKAEKVPYCESKSKRSSIDVLPPNWIGECSDEDSKQTVSCLMKAIEGMQPQINDMERRLGLMQSVEPVLANAIKTLQKVVDKTHRRRLSDTGHGIFLTLNHECEMIANVIAEAENVEVKGGRRLDIKNIQKSLTADILKRLAAGTPLTEVCRKVKAIEGMQTQIKDMERRIGKMFVIEHFLEYAIKTLEKVVDVGGMGRRRRLDHGPPVNKITVDEFVPDLFSSLDFLGSVDFLGSGDASVAKTAAIKNVVKALTARIIKRLDDGQPLVDMWHKMKDLEGMQPQVNDMGRRLDIAREVAPKIKAANILVDKLVVTPMKEMHIDMEEVGEGGFELSYTAGVSNIQKALTVRILKHLDDDEALVTVEQKIENLRLMKSDIDKLEKMYFNVVGFGLEPSLEYIFQDLQKVVDVTGMSDK